MDITPRHFGFSEILWGTLALLGCIGMIVFESACGHNWGLSLPERQKLRVALKTGNL